jgi:hypothetical protein
MSPSRLQQIRKKAMKARRASIVICSRR